MSTSANKFLSEELNQLTSTQIWYFQVFFHHMNSVEMLSKFKNLKTKEFESPIISKIIFRWQSPLQSNLTKVDKPNIQVKRATFKSLWTQTIL